MERLGSYRVIERTPAALRLRKTDLLLLAYASIVAMLALGALLGALIHPLLPTFWGMVIFIPLIMISLRRIDRIAEKGVVLVVRRRFGIIEEGRGGSYRAAPRRFLELDGQRMAATEVVSVQTRRLKPPDGPQRASVWIVQEGRAVLVDTLDDEDEADDLAREIRARLGLPKSSPQSAVEHASTLSCFAMTMLLCVDFLGGMSAYARAAWFVRWESDFRGWEPRLRILLLVTLGILVVDALVVRLIGLWLRKPARKEAAKRFGLSRSIHTDDMTV